MEPATKDDVRLLVNKLDEVLAILRKGNSAPAPSQAGGAVAPDSDLDSQWGDPEVRSKPRDWTGENFIGRKFSECSPEFLDQLAGLFDWRAQKDDERGAKGEMYNGKLKSGNLARRDAARARGWAARKRNGWAPPATADDLDAFGGDPDIPF